MKRRILTALVAIPLVLGVVGCTNPWPLGVLAVLVAVVCAIELAALVDMKAAAAFFAVVMVAGAAAGAGLQWGFWGGDSLRSGITTAVIWGLGILGFFLLIRGSRSADALASGSAWFGAGLTALLMIQRPHFSSGFEWSLPAPVLLALMPIWAGDTAAMLGGKAFGKHKLAPSISPNKTWEGAIANFAASLLVGWGVGAWLGYETWVGLTCGAAVGVFGQLGDLFESALKRAAGKKDSGTILPGHGGALDRIDALLGAAVPVWLILWLSGSI